MCASEHSSTENNTTATSVNITKKSSKRRHCGCHSNGSWRSWYGLTILLATGALVAQGGWRLLLYTRLSWPASERPFWELRAYMVLIGGSVVLLPIFLVSAMCRVGNMANDGVTLGTHLALCSQDTVLATTGRTWLRRMWIHSGPTASFVHLVMAFLLVLSRLIMEAKLIHLGYLDQDRVLSSNWPKFSNIFNLGLSGTDNSTTSSTATSQDVLYDQISAQFTAPSLPNWETINYAFALIAFGLQYSACFWQTNKSIGILFSLHNVCVAIVSLCALEGFSVLYKAGAQNGVQLYSIEESLQLPRVVSSALCLLTLSLLLSTTAILHLYGQNKLQSFLVRLNKKYQIALAAPEGSVREYTAHGLALLYLVSVVVASAPLLRDLAAISRVAHCPSCLVAAAAILLHLFVWVLLWLLLSIKHSWIFKVRVTLGNAFLRSAEHIKLVHQVDLKQKSGDTGAPMMIVEKGVVTTVDDVNIRSQVNELVEAHHRGERLRWQQEEVFWHKQETGDASDNGGSGAVNGSQVNVKDKVESKPPANRLETIVESEMKDASNLAPELAVTSAIISDAVEVSQYQYGIENLHCAGGLPTNPQPPQLHHQLPQLHHPTPQHQPEAVDFACSRQLYQNDPLLQDHFHQEIEECSSSQKLAVVHRLPQLNAESMELASAVSDGRPCDVTLMTSEQQQHQQQLLEQQHHLVAELERLASSDDSSGFLSGSSHETDPPTQPLLIPSTISGGRVASMSLQRPAGFSSRHGALGYGELSQGMAVSTACTLPTRLVANQRQQSQQQHDLDPTSLCLPLPRSTAFAYPPPLEPKPEPVDPFTVHPAPEPSSLGVRMDIHQPIYRNTIGLVDSRG